MLQIGPTTMAAEIPAQTLPLKRTWSPCSRRWLQWTLKTPPCVKHAWTVRKMLCDKRSPAAYWCSHSQNCTCSDRSSGNRWALSETGMDSSACQNYLRTLGWDSTNSRVIPRELLHGSSSTAANKASSLASLRTVRGGPAFKRAVGFTFPVSRRRCSHRRNTLVSGWRRPR
jgi:hypothetical protein